VSTYAELRSADFQFGANCEPPAQLAGAFVDGPPNGTRHLVTAEPLFRAYHECDEVNTERESYGTVYQYPLAEYAAHVRAAGSPRGYAGRAACVRLVWDIDRANDLDAALADARKLVTYLRGWYGSHAERGTGAYFSGAKGFHVTLVALPGYHPFAHVPRVARLLALTLARQAGVAVDPAVYDHQRLFRLPNSRHPRTGLYKRFLDHDELFALDAARVRELARHPAGFSVPSVNEDCEQFARDWIEAEERVLKGRAALASDVSRRDSAACPVVPKFVRDFIGFGDFQDPGRAVTLFRAAAALTEQGTPAHVVRGLLEEPALKMGLDAYETEKQLVAGIIHGTRKGAA
jgi:hypothetical protein